MGNNRVNKGKRGNNIHTYKSTGKGVHGTIDDTKGRCVLGIDPGLEGYFVIMRDGKLGRIWTDPMPIKKFGKQREIDFDGVHAYLHSVSEYHYGPIPVFLERAVSFGMGSTGAFNYGRGFAALEIALKLLQFPVTYVEPGKWTKEMHAGISKDLKPKAKSLVALNRLYPRYEKLLPCNTKGRLLEGAVDALLIAGYGMRQLAPVQKLDMPDFY